MGIKITLFITLILYAFVISQSFFYLLALTRVTQRMQAMTYIEYRQLVDQALQTSLPAVYYLSLAASVALTALCVVNPAGPLFIASLVALAALLIDILLAVSGNQPINRAIRRWTPESYPGNWEQYRSRWQHFYRLRQVCNITGFISLIAAMIFGIN